MNRMTILNRVNIINLAKSVVWSLNGIYNEVKFFKLLPSCKSVNPLHYYYLKITKAIIDW